VQEWLKRYEEKKPGDTLKTVQERFKDTRRKSLGMHGRQRKNGSKTRGEGAWECTEDSARTVQRHGEKKLEDALKTVQEWFRNTTRRSLGMH